MARRYELTDEAWDVVSDFFIETHGRGRPRLSDRLMLDGVLWVLCSGARVLHGEIYLSASAHGQRCINGFEAGATKNGCSPTRATTPKRYAATAINIECNPSSRCAR